VEGATGAEAEAWLQGLRCGNLRWLSRQRGTRDGYLTIQVNYGSTRRTATKGIDQERPFGGCSHIWHEQLQRSHHVEVGSYGSWRMAAFGHFVRPRRWYVLDKPIIALALRPALADGA